MIGPADTRYAEHDGVHIAYQHVPGPASRRLLYLTDVRAPIDLLGDDPLLAQALRRLARVGDLVLSDLRGCGASDAVDARKLPALQAWTDDCVALLDALGWQDATLITPAEPSLVAMHTAATHPSRVSGLVLINPFARFVRGDHYPHGLPQALLDGYVAAYARRSGTGSLADVLAPSRASDPVFRRWLARAERLGVAPTGAAAIYRLFAATDLTGILPAIHAPTLILRRTGDRHVREGHARYLADHLPNARLLELEGDDHVWYSGDVDAIVDAIERFLTGTRQPGDGNRVLATVMFSDIVGSTARAVELGDDGWRLLLEQHDEVVAGHVAAFRGEVVKSTGDGVLATFDGPARALHCASGLRDALAALGLPVRIGLHTGEVEIVGTGGSDVTGVAVHIAARVAALADPGEILVSESVPPLVVGSRIGFEDRGVRELRGADRPWRLYAVSTA